MHPTNRPVRRYPPALTLLAVAAITACSPSSGTGAEAPSAPSPTAATAGEAWAGDCPHGDSSALAPVAHVAVVELSASERDPALLADRLDRLRHLAQQAADCEAPFTVHLLTGSRSDRIFDTVFDSPLGTEIARDRQVDPMADDAMAVVIPALEAAYGGADDGAGSDPGAAYRVLADELKRLGPDAGIDALVLSDGVTVTATVDLNRSLEGADLDELAAQVAPVVDLGGRVAVDWPAVGHTADPAAPPGPWLDALRALWQRVCETRHAASCTVTTI